METSLRLGLKTGEMTPDTRLVFDITLSQRPPECKKSHMLYVLGDPAGLEAEDHQILPMKLENGVVGMPLYQDVSDDIMIGGKDNVFDTITVNLQVRSGAKLCAEIKDFQIQFNKNFEQAHLAQKEEAARVGKIYNITPFVAFEFSRVEHKNCFSTYVPTLNLSEMNWTVSNRMIADHVKKHNGIFAINHPLAISLLKRKEFDPLQRLSVVARSAATLLSCEAYGASLVEVGYPMGRNGFDLQAYLTHWDLLSSGGLFLTGNGCNDSHRNNENWFTGNNFATWIGVDARLSHPVDGEAFVDALRKGRAYTGDPVKIKGPVSFETEDGFQQGTVFTTDNTSEIKVCFRAQNVKIGWRFRLVENGHEVFSEEITQTSYFHNSILTASPATVSFQRAELYDTDGAQALGTDDPHLTELGRKQAVRLGDYIKYLGYKGKIYTYNCNSAVETAQIIGSIAGLEITDWTPEKDTAELSEDTLFVGDAQRADKLIQRLNFCKYKLSPPDCSFTVLDTEGKLESRCKDVAYLTNAMISIAEEMLIERKRKSVREFMEKGVEVPEEILTTKSLKLLHIGDTHSEAYPFYEDLILKVKPDIIIHTGDFVDEVKVGRMINTEEEYETGLARITEILRNSGAKKIYVTPGNTVKKMPSKRRHLFDN